MPKQAIEIKPCPFCGNMPKHTTEEEGMHKGYVFPENVKCKTCNIIFFGDDAGRKWNTRHAE